MSSVVQRINEISQPRGGYISPDLFEVIKRDDGRTLAAVPSKIKALMGLTVDYLTRYFLGEKKEKAFEVSLMGAYILNDEKNAKQILNIINELNKDSVVAAFELVKYDVVFRRGKEYYPYQSKLYLTDDAINNIIIMIERSLSFFEEYGPVIQKGFSFEGGYTKEVTAGDGDFLTETVLWDFKTSKYEPTSKHTLQLLMYYLLGLHSIHEEFLGINKLGIFNPELNKIYLLDLKNISNEIFYEVSNVVLGYTMYDEDVTHWILVKEDLKMLDMISQIGLQ